MDIDELVSLLEGAIEIASELELDIDDLENPLGHLGILLFGCLLWTL